MIPRKRTKLGPDAAPPRIMLFSANVPQGRTFSVEGAQDALEGDGGWQDTPINDNVVSGGIGSDVPKRVDPLAEAISTTAEDDDVPEPDGLALALEVFIALEKPSKDELQTLADVVFPEGDERLELNKDPMQEALQDILGQAHSAIGGGLKPWSFDDLAAAVREVVSPSDDGTDNDGEE